MVHGGHWLSLFENADAVSANGEDKPRWIEACAAHDFTLPFGSSSFSSVTLNS